MRLLAISDLHVRNPDNRAFVRALAGSAEDWLVVAGDVGEGVDDLAMVLDTLGPRFARLVWVPGNHELWTVPDRGERGDGAAGRGAEKYARLVEACRARGVLTPEDPYAQWPGEGPPTVVVPMFLLYDYSFGPPSLTPREAVSWAMEEEILCADEHLLHPDPFPTREGWCAERVRLTRARLDALPPGTHTVLVNHFPLRRTHAVLPRIPRFSIWCGTTATDDWHVRYRARAVIYGHLHIPRTHVDDGVPFEEVSLGYPAQYAWRKDRVVRQVLPRPESPR